MVAVKLEGKRVVEPGKNVGIAIPIDGDWTL